MEYIFLVIVIIAVIFLLKLIQRKKIEKITLTPKKLKLWNHFLEQNVNFFYNLETENKNEFINRLINFLNKTRITPVNTNIKETDKLLIAASAIIPVFAFHNWEYDYLEEVLVYSDSFDQNYDTKSQDNNILGMVGSGVMSDKMILSLKAIRHGFSNEKDKKNTAIHEFIHLIDKQDGIIDGVPSILLNKNYIASWLDLIQRKMTEITQDKSDIRDYGAYNKAEFFSVASEYFFERPKLMEKQHPELFLYMNKIFNQVPNLKYEPNIVKIGRNSPCPCGSGKKYKHCCLAKK